MPLDAHAGQPDDVGPLNRLVIQRLDVFVNERYFVLRGRQRGQERQAGDRQIGPPAQERQRMLEPPIGDLEPRIDKHDAGHTPEPWLRFEMLGRRMSNA